MKLMEYIEKGGQKLRLGYTTGSCAAGAAKAAAVMLTRGRPVLKVKLKTLRGIDLVLDIEDIRFWDGENENIPEALNVLQSDASARGDVREHFAIAPAVNVPGAVAANQEGEPCFPGPAGIFPGLPTAVSCAVRKDSGDDPDVTDEALIYARVAFSDTPGIRIEGGEGVGRVTRPGLDQPVGNAAINSTPRRMIEENLLTLLAPEHPGLDVTIYVPMGRELSKKTFNPRLGIQGGISILGTTGIVEPMSDEALLATIRIEIKVRREEGLPVLPAAPGNYGKSFFLEKYGFSLDTAVTTSNFIYDTVRMATEAGFRRMLFVGHIGKLVKIAGGVPNTHSQYGDRRMEILTDIAEDIFFREGAQEGKNAQSSVDKALPIDILEREMSSEAVSKASQGDQSREAVSKASQGDQSREAVSKAPQGDQSREAVFRNLRQELAECVTTDAAVNVLMRYGLDREVMAEMTRRIKAVMEGWSGGLLQVEVVVFSKVHGEICRTNGALAYMATLKDSSGWKAPRMPI